MKTYLTYDRSIEIKYKEYTFLVDQLMDGDFIITTKDQKEVLEIVLKYRKGKRIKSLTKVFKIIRKIKKELKAKDKANQSDNQRVTKENELTQFLKNLRKESKQLLTKFKNTKDETNKNKETKRIHSGPDTGEAIKPEWPKDR